MAARFLALAIARTVDTLGKPADNGPMSGDDSTIKLPDDETKYDTKPGMTAVLERINQLGEQLNKKIDDAVIELRAEMQAGFRKLEHKLELHSKNVADLYADVRELEGRVDKLEEKAS